MMHKKPLLAMIAVVCAIIITPRCHGQIDSSRTLRALLLDGTVSQMTVTFYSSGNVSVRDSIIPSLGPDSSYLRLYSGLRFSGDTSVFIPMSGNWWLVPFDPNESPQALAAGTEIQIRCTCDDSPPAPPMIPGQCYPGLDFEKVIFYTCTRDGCSTCTRTMKKSISLFWGSSVGVIVKASSLAFNGITQ